MAAKWFYNKNGQNFGPFTAKKLRKKANTGEITADSYIRKGLAGDWVKAKQVRGLFKTKNAKSSAPSTDGPEETDPNDNPAPKPLKKDTTNSFISRKCPNCGAQLTKVEDSGHFYTCDYCKSTHELDLKSGSNPTPASLLSMIKRSVSKQEHGEAVQILELSLSIVSHDSQPQTLENEVGNNLSSQEAEAEAYKAKAEHILYHIQAYTRVFGSNSFFSNATSENANLGLEYINKSLELFPDNPIYLNLKGLLLWEGLSKKKEAIPLLEKAAILAPHDIAIQNNLKLIKSSSCFIATAAYGSPLATEINVLRNWRDNYLMETKWGQQFIYFYNRTSPPIAKFISKRRFCRYCIRCMLKPLIHLLSKRYSNTR